MSEKPIFKDCVVAIADDLDDYSWREEQVKKWVLLRKGAFSSIIDDNVTHLLCTRENFQRRTADVRKALKNKGTKIVTRDWLEDSINKNIRLRTLPFQLDEEARQELAKKRRIQKMEKFKENAENYVDERFWHVYRDSTHFPYQIQLKRNDEAKGNVGEKHLVTLWESNAKPYNYRCTTLFTKKSKNRGIRDSLNETPVDLKTGLKTFKKLFVKKTSIPWDDRIEKMGTTGPEHFQYQPPSGGKPVGLVNGRRASIFSEGGGTGAPDQTGKEEQHDDGLVEDTGVAKTSHKRSREEYPANDATLTSDDGERPAKLPRLQTAEAGSELGELEVDSDRESAADNNANSGPEPEEDIQGVQGDAEVLSDEAPQEFDGANDQDQLESDSVMNDGAPEAAEYDDEDQSGHDSAEGKGLAAPYNSEASDVEIHNEDEMVEEEEEEDVELNDAPRENTEQEAEDISRMYDEAQQAEMENDNEEEDDTRVNEEDYSPEAVKARRLAREVATAAANIFHESRRSVSFVPDSQAALIDRVRAQEAYLCARAKRTREREEKEDAEDSGEDDDDDDDDDDSGEELADERVGFGLDGAMDY